MLQQVTNVLSKRKPPCILQLIEQNVLWLKHYIQSIHNNCEP